MKSTDLTCSNGFGVKIGFDYSFRVSITSEDFTGRTFQFKVKKSKLTAAYLLELTNSADPDVSGVYFTDATLGIVDILIKAADSASIDPQNSVYEFYYTTATSKVILSTTRHFLNGSIFHGPFVYLLIFTSLKQMLDKSYDNRYYRSDNCKNNKSSCYKTYRRP